jgi:hypothetical protein
MENTQTQQKQARQALEAMLASDLFANTVALALAGVCIADESQESIADSFTDTLRLTICGSLFEAGMSNAEAFHWYETLMSRVAPFVAEIEASLLAAPSGAIISEEVMQ